MKFHFNKEFKNYKNQIIVCHLTLVLQPETLEESMVSTHCPEIEVEGVAHRHPDDKFDQKRGETIAASRACIKAFKKVRSITKDVREASVILMRESNLLLNRLDKLMSREVSHHSKLVEEV